MEANFGIALSTPKLFWVITYNLYLCKHDKNNNTKYVFAIQEK